MQQRRIDAPKALVEGQEERPAALLSPCPCHGRKTRHGVHGRRTIARSGESETRTDKALARAAVEASKSDDVFDRQSRYLGRPLRRACEDVRLGRGVEVGQPG